MKTTVVTHIHNESYLLDFWLRHHVDKFDHGIILDYNSTDNSRDVWRNIAPHWEFRPVDIPDFSADRLDALVNSVEKEIDGTRIVLTISEFLLGNPRLAEKRYYIPQIVLVRPEEVFSFDKQLAFHDQVKFGIGSDTELMPPWHARSMHQSPAEYGADGSSTGRHYHTIDNGPFLIYRVSTCLVTEQMFERRLQIQHRIPESDKSQNKGVQHTNWGKGLTREDLLAEELDIRSRAKDLSDLIAKYDK